MIKRSAPRRHSKKISRRSLLEAAFAGTGALIAGGLSPACQANSAPYSGKLLVTLQLEGGVDVTQLCDPKINTPGEKKINYWADSREPLQQGNITYAPVALNERLFKAFGARTMVINGIDSQTNSHDTGKLYNFTGANTETRPCLSALHAAAVAPNAPLSYVVFGGTTKTRGLVNFNRFDDLSMMKAIARPNATAWGAVKRKSGLETAETLIELAVLDEMGRPSLTPRQKASLTRFRESRVIREELGALEAVLPSDNELQPPGLKEQMQGALIAFKSGLTSTADIDLMGFDSHTFNDDVHEDLLTKLTEGLEFFWDYAEKLELADRILLVIGTDFGRTNFYNEGDGKDHWPIGSFIIMEKNAAWGNRVVGYTDDLHFAKPISPVTLNRDPTGIILTPAHVHRAIQEYLGISIFADSVGVGLTDTPVLPLFDENLQTDVSASITSLHKGSH